MRERADREGQRLELVSDGRLTLGMAVGWYEREFDACGVPFKQRGKIFEENLELMKQFWTGERVTGEARGVPFRNALMLARDSKSKEPITDNIPFAYNALAWLRGEISRVESAQELAAEARSAEGELPGSVAQPPFEMKDPCCHELTFRISTRLAAASGLC